MKRDVPAARLSVKGLKVPIPKLLDSCALQNFQPRPRTRPQEALQVSTLSTVERHIGHLEEQRVLCDFAVKRSAAAGLLPAQVESLTCRGGSGTRDSSSFVASCLRISCRLVELEARS